MFQLKSFGPVRIDRIACCVCFTRVMVVCICEGNMLVLTHLLSLFLVSLLTQEAKREPSTCSAPEDCLLSPSAGQPNQHT